MARRIVRLSPGFQRAMGRMRIAAVPARRAAVAAVVRGLGSGAELPSPGDTLAEFRPGRAFARRVPGQNLWVWYRFDAVTVTVVSVTDQPPVPFDDDRDLLEHLGVGDQAVALGNRLLDDTLGIDLVPMRRADEVTWVRSNRRKITWRR